MNYQGLFKIEEKIEACYIELADLEINGEVDTLEYNHYIKMIVELLNMEKKVLANLTYDDLIKLKELVRKKDNDKGVGLGFLINNYYGRLVNICDGLLGDDIYDYANTLKYDINQIMFTFIDYMINNEYYQDIRKELIYYKYNLIFKNFNSENNFIFNKDIKNVSLEANNYRTSDLPYLFVDKSILVLESIQDLRYIESLEEDFKNNNCEYVKVVILLINVLARLMLCEENTLSLIYSDLTYILESDEISLSVKELTKELLDILQNIKNRIRWAR